MATTRKHDTLLPAKPKRNNQPLPGSERIISQNPKGNYLAINYSATLARDVCNQIAQGETLTSICNKPGMPSIETFLAWVVEAEIQPEDKRLARFLETYKRARACQAEVFVDKAVTITNGINYQSERTANADVNAVKLQVDTLKWAAGKLRPSVYGDRPTESGGNTQVVVAIRFPDKKKPPREIKAEVE